MQIFETEHTDGEHLEALVTLSRAIADEPALGAMAEKLRKAPPATRAYMVGAWSRIAGSMTERASALRDLAGTLDDAAQVIGRELEAGR